MRRSVAAAGSSLFFALAPGTVAGLLPWWLTGWQAARPWTAWAWLPVRALGAALVVAGAALLVSAFVRFVVEGLGTPAPVAAPERLVIGGLYRYVRNPMYVAVVATVLGQALLLLRPVLLAYLAVATLAMVAFVRGYEEPELARRFGADYRAYRQAVPGWWPRRRPWHPAR
jgi:protein-S-isoprenylcysteine O-methyltransferase Ste14